MDIATSRTGGALRQLWNARVPESLEALRAPVKHWVLLRSNQLGDPPNLDWVPRDPVVRFLSASLYGLSGRTPSDGQISEYKPFFQQYYRNLVWWLQAQRRLVEISDRMEEQGIVCLPLKGSSLQGQVYGNSGLRFMSDLDLLIHMEDWIQSGQVLEDLGFCLLPEGQLEDLACLASLPLVSWPTELFYMDGHGLVIELHRHLISTPWFLPAYQIDMGPVWDRSLTIQGQRSLSSVDMLAHLCLHASMHGLQSMQTFFDIDVWVRSLPENWDWNSFIKLVGSWQVRSAAYHALSFSQYLMGTPLPVEVLSRLDPGWAARFRVQCILSYEALLADRPSVGKRYPTLVKLMLVDRIPSIMRVLFQVLKPPPDRRQEYQAGSDSLFQHWKHIWKIFRRGD
jgi:hypothetical protein